jgi:hypothetical protein
MVIITMGFGACVFTVAAMSPNSVPQAVAVLAVIAALFFGFTFWHRYGKGGSFSLGFLLNSRRNRRDDGLKDYEPRVAGRDAAQSATMQGTNRPITAEEAHDIRISCDNTWVPASGRRSRNK